MEHETRNVPFEFRDGSGDGGTLDGYAVMFNSPAVIQEQGKKFRETVAPGAVDRTIASPDRIQMQFDHGQHPFFGSLPIGRYDSMQPDSRGLHVTGPLSNSWMVEPIRAAIKDRAITGMSFRFSVPEGGDTWDYSGDIPERTITEMKIYEMGPVVNPAYTDTSVGVRSALNLLDDDQRQALLNPVTPDDGSPVEAPVTPDDGSQTRTQTQRAALARVALRKALA